MKNLICLFRKVTISNTIFSKKCISSCRFASHACGVLFPLGLLTQYILNYSYVYSLEAFHPVSQHCSSISHFPLFFNCIGQGERSRGGQGVAIKISNFFFTTLADFSSKDVYSKFQFKNISRDGCFSAALEYVIILQVFDFHHPLCTVRDHARVYFSGGNKQINWHFRKYSLLQLPLFLHSNSLSLANKNMIK